MSAECDPHPGVTAEGVGVEVAECEGEAGQGELGGGGDPGGEARADPRLVAGVPVQSQEPVNLHTFLIFFSNGVQVHIQRIS